jgi:capsular exopolysaccharide synthesis family protein
LAERLDRRIKDEEGMEREFGLPVLAAVPSVGGRWGAASASGSGLGKRSHAPIGFSTPTSLLLEPFRRLRSNLQYFNVDRKMQVILITSALPQQGKTITTLNLGLILALSGERVIMIESDLRRPMLHTYLGMTNDLGVTSILAGTSSFGEAMQLVQVDEYVASEVLTHDPARLSKNLYCITSGPLPPNPAELINSHRMQELIEEATQAADYVLIDTPPLLLVADALSLAKGVDGVIITARANSTTRDEAKRVTTMLERVGANAVGVVVGDVRVGRGNYYYKYGYYREAPAK